MLYVYELRFYRRDGALSANYQVLFASDRHAILSARQLLNDRLSLVSVSQDGRRVADLASSSEPQAA